MIQRFSKNTKGKDYIVGDIHGCFTKLETELHVLGFDKTKDRLFSVGDLTDRGPESEKALDWISQNWFFPVRGNHEQMLIDAYEEPHTIINLIQNGGSWYTQLSEDEQENFSKVFNSIPFAIEIESDTGIIGIVHAEVAWNDWNRFKEALSLDDDRVKMMAIWGRSKITDEDDTRVEGVDYVVVGHTPVKNICRLGNVYYIDTGAVFTGKFTFWEV